MSKSKGNEQRKLSTTLLSDYAHYVRWSNGRLKDCSGWGYAGPRSASEFEGAKDVMVRRREELKQMAPKEFPCVGVIQCISCNYEESAPFYLYGSDLQQLLSGLAREVKRRQ